GGMPVGTPFRHARIPGATDALVQGPDAMRQEVAADDPEVGTAVARQTRSHLPPHAQHCLPADADHVGADAAGDDRAFLHGLDADAAGRPAAHHRQLLVYHRLLSRRPTPDSAGLLAPYHL